MTQVPVGKGPKRNGIDPAVGLALRRSAAPLGVLAACGACTTAPVRETAPAFEPGVELPAGQGREILMASCLSCHQLTGLPLFAAFYTRDSWLTLVLTMKGHGAEIDDADRGARGLLGAILRAGAECRAGGSLARRTSSAAAWRRDARARRRSRRPERARNDAPASR